jgi:hypothetical protein
MVLEQGEISLSKACHGQREDFEEEVDALNDFTLFHFLLRLIPLDRV